MKFFKKKNWKFFFWKIYRWIVLNYLTLLLARNFFCDHTCQKMFHGFVISACSQFFCDHACQKMFHARLKILFFSPSASHFFVYVLSLKILFFAALLALTEINFVFLACSQILLRPCLPTNVSRELENFIFFLMLAIFIFYASLKI